MENKQIQEKNIIEAYDKYLEAIFRFCYFKTKDRELAKDLAQQTFLKAWTYLNDGQIIDNLRPFLYKIAGNMVIDWYRKQKKESLDTLMEQGFDPIDPQASASHLAEVEILLKNLNRLPAKDKELIVWHYVEDLSIKEIGQMLHESENTVSVRIHRAREKLKKIIT